MFSNGRGSGITNCKERSMFTGFVFNKETVYCAGTKKKYAIVFFFDSPGCCNGLVNYDLVYGYIVTKQHFRKLIPALITAVFLGRQARRLVMNS